MIGLWYLLLVEILCFVLTFNFNRKDVMAPSVVLTMVFIFSTSLAIMNGHRWRINYDFTSCVILSLGIFLFCLTDIWVRNRSIQTKNFKSQIIPIEVNNKITWLIVLVDIVIVYFVYYEVQRIAATNTWFDNAFYAYRMITSHSEDIDTEQYMDGKINQAMKIVIVSGFLYAYFFINNVFVCKQRIKKNVLFILPPFILCVMTIMTGVRTNILRLCVFCLICSYILFQFKRNWKICIPWKFIKIMIGSLVIILIIFFTLQSVLGRSEGGSVDGFTVISNYAGAPIVHFNQYIQKPPPTNEVFAQETFTGVWNALYKLGLTNKKYLAHEEFRHLTSTDSGNVYTLFRRFIQDFGVLGMCVMTILLSYFFSYVYNRKIRLQRLNYRTMIIIIEYGYVYYIVAMSSVDNFIHDYVNVGTIIMFVVLHLMCRLVTSSKYRNIA